MTVTSIRGDKLCPMCLRSDVRLKRSHAINNAFFRKIKQNGQFQGISIADETSVRMQKTFDEELLCGECEALFNDRFDRYSIRQFDKFRQELDQGDCGKRRVSMEDAERLSCYFLSVFWRASLMCSGRYGKFEVPSEVFLAMDRVLRKTDDPFMNFSYSLRQAVGPSGPMSVNVLALPQSSTGVTKRNQGQKRVHLMRFTVMGIEAMALFGKIPYSSRFAPGRIKKGAKSVFIRKFNFLEDPFLVEAVRVAGSI